MRCILPALLLGIVLVSQARGEVTRLDIQKREPYAGGKEHGERGSYEKLTGVVHFALDEVYNENLRVRDLQLAEMNDQRQVEFWADFEILVPKDLAKANGALLYEVNNRGNKTAPGIFDGGADDFLLRQGFIVVWSGWIAEVLPAEGKFKMWAPTAKDAKDDQPLKGIVRQEVIVDKETPRACLAHRGRQGSYRPTAAGLPKATLTVREREADERKAVPREDWKLIVTEESYQNKPWPLPVVEVEVQGGLKPGWIYEVVYEAQDPVVQGVGLAGIRDLVSFLKYETNKRNPLVVSGKSVATRAHGFGTSQSGRCLRQFLHDGFNEDEHRRRVFDGIISHVAGGGLGSFNHRFASPTRTNGQHDEHDFPADFFPFTYGDSRDPFTEKTDRVLGRYRTVDIPKVFHTQSSSEYWHRSGSLVHTDPLGKEDAEIPPEVRLYTFGGTQHGAGSGVPGPRGAGQHPTCPADYRPLMRALLMALDAWVKDGTEPPPSVYPKIADGSLVPWQQDKSGWPAIPGVNYPKVIQQPDFLYRGPQWPTEMIATVEPPEVRGHYNVRVPAYGPDGNEKGTLLLPAVKVPVATYASWNLRHASIGAEGELLSLQGSYIPFLRTKEDRVAAKDPRPALLERYRDFADYQQQYLAAAEELVAARYLLAEDLPRLKALCDKFQSDFEVK